MKMIVDEKTEDLILLLSLVKTIIQNIKKKKMFCVKSSLMWCTTFDTISNLLCPYISAEFSKKLIARG